jgi:hypothetical protein
MLRLLVWLVILGALVYLTFWVIDRRVAGDDERHPPRRPRAGGSPDGPRGSSGGPVGPDDDEDFLRELDRRRRSQDG